MKKIFCMIVLMMLSVMTAGGAQAPVESTETIVPEVPEDIPADSGENVTGGNIDGESKPEQQEGVRVTVKSSGGRTVLYLRLRRVRNRAGGGRNRACGRHGKSGLLRRLRHLVLYCLSGEE